MTHAPLESLKRKLMKAALELMSSGGAEEFNSFDLIADGRRLVIEVALLPPVTRECQGAQRARPTRSARLAKRGSGVVGRRTLSGQT